MEKTLKRTIEHFGSKSALARELGVTYQAVQCWKNIPCKWALTIERISGGKITALEILESAPDPLLVESA